MKTNSKLLLFAFLCSIFLFNCNSNVRPGPPKVLIFSKTAGYHHASIPNGIAAIQKLGVEHNFEVDTTTLSNTFNDENLAQYSAVIFLNTTGDVLDANEEIAFERYIQAGGGFVGVHAASDTEYGWQWYGKLVGAYFTSHPHIQKAKFIIKDRDFEATSFFTDTIWARTDELYNFKNINPDVNVLITIDESSYEGGINGDFHPMSWYHNYDGGRAFFTALGHTEESYEEEAYLKHLWGGIKYAIGGNLNLDWSQATTQLPPEGSRFIKRPLVLGEFYEPTEMTILPNHDVLVAQRRGELLLYKKETETLKQVGFLDVYSSTDVEDVNAEEGFMGLQKDPNFAENHWIYVFYSPTGEAWVNRLSRIKFEDDTLQMDTEQVILDVDSQRDICCHTGGSIAFGGDGLLYLSTGDNSTPFNDKEAEFVNDGYAPLNDLPGKKQYDARRSSGNTNDLRGKIIRIKVNEDGSYEIPEGNLFPVGMAKTRPEIYTMGHRNPYRISVDPMKGYVYWGDVGPDAVDDLFATRGPRGYDEMNQARGPGNYGWPLFIADNKPYLAYDYSNGNSGAPFDPAKPINNSENNTGLTELPPAQPAYIYYDYGKSDIWNEVKSGGRNAMAGPTYYDHLYEGENKLPTYYNGKVIIYDWIRGWMKAATFFDDGTFNRVEPFAPDVKVSNLIDMELGPDGTLYILEYGSGWFTKNDDSGLSYIEFFEGNMPPTINDLVIDKTSGQAPLTISASISASDLEGEALSYIWRFGDGKLEETKDTFMSHTYDSIGSFKLTVEVKDESGESTTGNARTIVSGNSRPEIAIDVEGGNQTFFVAGTPVKYNVTVSDEEDDKSSIDMSKVFVEVDYMDGFDEVSLTMGHQEGSMISKGETLTLSETCKACHKWNETSVGPSYMAISEKYKEDEDAISYLQKKMLGGSTGVWGEAVMPVNPALKKEDAWHIAKYILSLTEEEDERKSLPMKGFITPSTKNGSSVMVLTASYTDRGADRTGSLTGVTRKVLKNSTISVKSARDLDGFSPMKFGEMDLLISPTGAGHFSLSNIDLKGVRGINVVAGWQEAPKVGYALEARLNRPDGKIIGQGRMEPPKPGSQSGIVPIRFTEKMDIVADKLYFTYRPDKGDKLSAGEAVALMNVIFSAD